MPEFAFPAPIPEKVFRNFPLGPRIFGHDQVIEAFTQHCRCVQPIDSRGALIPELYDAVCILNEDRVTGQVKQRRIFRQAFHLRAADRIEGTEVNDQALKVGIEHPHRQREYPPQNGQTDAHPHFGQDAANHEKQDKHVDRGERDRHPAIQHRSGKDDAESRHREDDAAGFSELSRLVRQYSMRQKVKDKESQIDRNAEHVCREMGPAERDQHIYDQAGRDGQRDNGYR